jgi:imidazole glycerol-phosphate synthase subunit HisH
MIGILDYGLGNVMAFSNIYKRLNIPACIITDANKIDSMEKLILPGVGSFDWAIERLNSSNMRDALDESVLEKKTPILGVCVGMQMMATGSDEGNSNGLGWIDARVKHFSKLSNISLDLPHMGWNDVETHYEHPLFKNLQKEAIFYFLHSYYFQESNKSQILATSNYGGIYTSCVFKDNIYGVQFHPEKSHQWGIQLLKNFSEIKNVEI